MSHMIPGLESYRYASQIAQVAERVIRTDEEGPAAHLDHLALELVVHVTAAMCSLHADDRDLAVARARVAAIACGEEIELAFDQELLEAAPFWRGKSAVARLLPALSALRVAKRGEPARSSVVEARISEAC